MKLYFCLFDTDTKEEVVNCYSNFDFGAYEQIEVNRKKNRLKFIYVKFTSPFV